MPIDATFVFGPTANRELFEATADHVIDGVSEFGTAIAESVEGDFDLNTPETQRFMRDFQRNRIPMINRTTQDQVVKAVSAAEAAGETAIEIEARISHVFDNARDNRAANIGISETTRSSSFGSDDSGRQNNMNNKQWLSQNDGKVRPLHTHGSLHGQIQAYGDVFTDASGNTGQGPGAMEGGASNNSHCRCWTAPTSHKSRKQIAGNRSNQGVLDAADDLRSPIASAMATDIRPVFDEQERRALASFRAGETVAQIMREVSSQADIGAIAAISQASVNRGR